MAGGMDLGDGGKSKKKPLDTAINLVPFIDLMAVTISFLIKPQFGRRSAASRWLRRVDRLTLPSSRRN